MNVTPRLKSEATWKRDAFHGSTRAIIDMAYMRRSERSFSWSTKADLAFLASLVYIVKHLIKAWFTCVIGRGHTRAKEAS